MSFFLCLLLTRVLFKRALFRVGEIHVSCAHYSCRLIPRDKLLLLSPRFLTGSHLAGPWQAPLQALQRTLGNEWAAAGRESGLGLHSPPPPCKPSHLLLLSLHHVFVGRYGPQLRFLHITSSSAFPNSIPAVLKRPPPKCRPAHYQTSWRVQFVHVIFHLLSFRYWFIFLLLYITITTFQIAVIVAEAQMVLNWEWGALCRFYTIVLHPT